MRHNNKQNSKKQFNFAQNQAIFSDMEARLMASIVALCTKRTPFENMDGKLLSQLDILRVRYSLEEQHQLVSQLWNVYAELVIGLPSGTELDLDAFFLALSESFNITNNERSGSTEVADNALMACAHLAECVGFAFSAISPRLNQMVIYNDAIAISPVVRWRALKRINNALSVSSLLHEHFPQFAATVIQCLIKGGEEISSNRELLELVASILSTSASLIKPPLLVDLQRHVCLAALSPNPDIGVFKMLNALLEHNHEGIPLPIQAARTVFWRDYSRKPPEFREQVAKGRGLCQIYVRPRRVPCCGDFNNDKSTTTAISAASIANAEPKDLNSAASATSIVNGKPREIGANKMQHSMEKRYGDVPTTSKSISRETSAQQSYKSKENELSNGGRKQPRPFSFHDNDSDSSDIIEIDDDDGQAEDAATSTAKEVVKNVSMERLEQPPPLLFEGGDDFDLRTPDEILKDFILD